MDEPPPGSFWSEKKRTVGRALAFARSKPTGGRVGVRRDGVAAAIKLARSMAQDNPRYHRGARHRTLTEAILNASMEKFAGRAPDSIAAVDLAALKAAVEEWFSRNVVPCCYVVPCALMPDLSAFPHARPFAIGPVAFRHVSDFLKARNSANPEERMVDEIHHGQLLERMKERHAKWVAEVEIDGCETGKASDIADLAVDIAIVGVQLVVPRITPATWRV